MEERLKFIAALLDGMQFKRTSYALDRVARQTALSRLYSEVAADVDADLKALTAWLGAAHDPARSSRGLDTSGGWRRYFCVAWWINREDFDLVCLMPHR